MYNLFKILFPVLTSVSYNVRNLYVIIRNCTCTINNGTLYQAWRFNASAQTLCIYLKYIMYTIDEL